MESQQTHYTLCLILFAACFASLPPCEALPNPMALASYFSPISIGMYFADYTYDILDSIIESGLCPEKPAQESEWEGHASTEWPGMIFFASDTHEDVELYYNHSYQSFHTHDMKTHLVDRGFDPNLPTVIYVHAYSQNQTSKWLRTVREDYVKLNPKKEPKINLMFFDWNKFAALGYSASAKWVPALAKILSDFINTLAEFTHMDTMKVHLISFSLGVHICGMAGRQSERKIGRITALDPAGWCFSEIYDHSYTQYGLKATDAYQVDASHFDMKFLGSRVPVGTVDIYMNGGAAQPGCSSGYLAKVKSALTMVKDLSSHSLGEGHSRGAVQSVYAVEDQCHQIAYECPSYEQFQAGECGECNQSNDQCFSTSIYGVQEVSSNWRPPRIYGHHRRMFVNTAAKQPFCVQHYQIRVNLKGYDTFDKGLAYEGRAQKEAERISKAFKASRPQIILQDDQGVDWFATNLEHEWHPLVFTALAMDDNRSKVRKTVRARLVMEYSRQSIQFSDGVDSVQVNYMSHLEYDQRQKFSTKLCWASSNTDISPRNFLKAILVLWLVECKPDKSVEENTERERAANE